MAMQQLYTEYPILLQFLLGVFGCFAAGWLKRRLAQHAWFARPSVCIAGETLSRDVEEFPVTELNDTAPAIENTFAQMCSQDPLGGDVGDDESPARVDNRVRTKTRTKHRARTMKYLVTRLVQELTPDMPTSGCPDAVIHTSADEALLPEELSPFSNILGNDFMKHNKVVGSRETSTLPPQLPGTVESHQSAAKSCIETLRRCQLLPSRHEQPCGENDVALDEEQYDNTAQEQHAPVAMRFLWSTMEDDDDVECFRACPVLGGKIAEYEKMQHHDSSTYAEDDDPEEEHTPRSGNLVDGKDDDCEWKEKDDSKNESRRGFDDWMTPFDDMFTEHLQGTTSTNSIASHRRVGVARAVSDVAPTLQPPTANSDAIISAQLQPALPTDAQQFYTNGNSVYMLACLEAPTSLCVGKGMFGKAPTGGINIADVLEDLTDDYVTS